MSGPVSREEWEREAADLQADPQVTRLLATLRAGLLPDLADPGVLAAIAKLEAHAERCPYTDAELLARSTPEVREQYERDLKREREQSEQKRHLAAPRASRKQHSATLSGQCHVSKVDCIFHAVHMQSATTASNLRCCGSRVVLCLPVGTHLV